jgi:hypothetical protein
MIETQFAMNCNEGCNDSALEVALQRHQPARLTPLDQRTHWLRSPSDSLGDQSGAILPASLVAGFFLSSQAAAPAAQGCRRVSQASCAVAQVAAQQGGLAV